MRTIVALFIGSLVATNLAVSAQEPTFPAIVQMAYYARPGMEDQVLRLRLAATEVLAKRGLARGRVWRTMNSPRATLDPAGPTVIWQGEFATEAELKQYEEVADRDPDFLAIRKQMGGVTTRTERRYFSERR